MDTERVYPCVWIARRLLTHHDLAPGVRSTLGELLERLEREIGRHVGAVESPASDQWIASNPFSLNVSIQRRQVHVDQYLHPLPTATSISSTRQVA